MPLRKARNTFHNRAAAPLACVSSTGWQITAGARLYVQQQGATAGKAIELIVEDDCSLPHKAKRRVRDLIVADKVKALAGFRLTRLGSAIGRQAPDVKLILVRTTLQSPPADGQANQIVSHIAKRKKAMKPSISLGMVTAVSAFAVGLALMPGAARAADGKTFVMKISLPTLNDSTHQLAKNYAAALEKDSGGRIKAQVFPLSQLGSIPRQIEGTQFGSIQSTILPPEFFAGVDSRFEVMAAPGLVDSMEHAQRLAADSTIQALMLGLGADKGLHGVGFMMVSPSSVISRAPIRHLGDLKGKKIRVLASQFQIVPFGQIGATPVALSLGDVLPALQQGAIDGAVSGIKNFSAMHFADTSKYVTEIGQPNIFAVVEVSKKWYDTLPPDLQRIVDRDGNRESMAIAPEALASVNGARKDWVAGGGELITLPPDEQASMLKTLMAAGKRVAAAKPQVSAAFQVVTEAAQRTR